MGKNNKIKIKLEEIDKENRFIVPDRYFEDLPTRVQKRLPLGAGKNSRNWFNKPVFKYSFVATLLLLIGIMSVLYYNQKPNFNTAIIAHTPPSDSVIEEYIIANYEGEEEIMVELERTETVLDLAYEDYIIQEMQPEEIEEIVSQL